MTFLLPVAGLHLACMIDSLNRQCSQSAQQSPKACSGVPQVVWYKRVSQMVYRPNATPVVLA